MRGIDARRLLRGMLCSLGFAAVVFADGALKRWCTENIRGADDVPLIPGVISLTYTENMGAAFGILENGRWFFVALGALVIFGMLWLIYRETELRENAACMTGLVLIMSGTLGNLIDRLFQGYVVDMFQTEFVDFAIFNIADIALCCGGAVFCLSLLLSEYKRPANGGEKP